MSNKRVILVNNSRLLREMLRRVVERETHLDVVQELIDHRDLPAALEFFQPEWAILAVGAGGASRGWAETCVTAYPSVRFILLALDQGRLTMRWQTACEEDLTSLSLKDFVQILEKDLQRT